MISRLIVLAFAAALAACTSTGGPTADTAAEFDPACEQQYSGGAASALANSRQGCAIAPP